ncbi:hypothetical protein G3545_18935 [Starkeya sp. ORNL1]|uniref:hypothetical protein n=1 Tax=Starkeya sp. ORNL1 TaxID=2709380 RepID=UPI0014644EBF|nr:hypothetical protein [Starkeya sp. ORNL1]QJP15547.1 hypothetical protein G3545_18935 [Starkeya sp. ORNL1]
MSLDRLIGMVAGGERLAAALDIIRNVGGETRPAGIDRGLPQAPGTVKPSADVVPGGPAVPEDASRQAADTDLYTRAALPASRSLLGLRPPLLEGLRTSMPGQGQRPASTTSGGAGASTGTMTAANPAIAGESSSPASQPSHAIGAFDPVQAAIEASAADVPMSSPATVPSAADDGSLLGDLVARMAEAHEEGASAGADAFPGFAGSGVIGEAGVAAHIGDAVDARQVASQADGTAAEVAARTADAPDRASARSASAVTPASAATAASADAASLASARTHGTVSAMGDVPRLDAALRDPLAFAAMPGGSALPERAGIIASFVLNAAMIPGWPPPRPIESARPDAAIAVHQLQMGVDEKETADYLARLGVPASLLARLAAWLEAFKRRARILFGLMILLGSTLAVLRGLKEEDEADEDELAAPDGRTRLFLR